MDLKDGNPSKKEFEHAIASGMTSGHVDEHEAVFANEVNGSNCHVTDANYVFQHTPMIQVLPAARQLGEHIGKRQGSVELNACATGNKRISFRTDISDKGFWK